MGAVVGVQLVAILKASYLLVTSLALFKRTPRARMARGKRANQDAHWAAGWLIMVYPHLGSNLCRRGRAGLSNLSQSGPLDVQSRRKLLAIEALQPCGMHSASHQPGSHLSGVSLDSVFIMREIVGLG